MGLFKRQEPDEPAGMADLRARHRAAAEGARQRAEAVAEERYQRELVAKRAKLRKLCGLDSHDRCRH